MHSYTDPRKPALAFHSDGRWFAWDESTRLICSRPSYEALIQRLTELGYGTISPNSRLAATIRDKFRMKGFRT